MATTTVTHPCTRDRVCAAARQWLREIRGVLCWSRYDVLMMITHRVYLDDSENGGHLAIGGHVASVETWDRVIQEWVSVLQDFEVRWFHSTDFHGGYGDFSGWATDDPRRSIFYERLVRIIEIANLRPVAYSIPSEYRAAPNIPTSRPRVSGSRSPSEPRAF